MYKFQFDESAWPIVTIGAEGVGTVEDTKEYIAHWERWLACIEPIGVVMVSLHTEQPRVDQQARKLANRWHKKNKDRLARRCVGIATVVKSPQLMALYKPLASRYTKRTMGCPGELFTTQEEARAWLGDRFFDATSY